MIPAPHRVHRAGYVLGVILVAMVVFSLVVTGLLTHSQMHAIESGERIGQYQSLWSGEAGIVDAIHHLAYDPSFRSSPYTITGSLNHVNYSVDVVATATNYVITSRGQSAHWKQSIKQTVEVIPTGWHDVATYYAVFAGNGVIDKDEDATIIGPRYSPNLLPGGIVPSMPSLDLFYYDQLIAYASTNGLSSHPANLILAGDYFVQGSATFTSVSGSGRLIGSNDITISSSGTLGSNLTVIVGHDLKLNDDAVVLADTLMYAENKLDIKNRVNLGARCASIGIARIDIGADAALRGFLYAGDECHFNDSSTLFGTVLSAGKTKLHQDAAVTFSSSQLPLTMPPGLEGGGVHQVTRLKWTAL